jgi:phage gpG-like protein
VSDLNVRVDGLDALTRRLTGAERVVGAELRTMVNRLTIAGARASQGKVGVKTGTLRRSLTHQPATFAGGVARGAFGSNVPYARVHNDGRGPVVARGRALRFTIGGVVIFRKSVGPAKGRRYMEAGAAEVRRRMPGEIAQLKRRIARALGAS